MSIGKGYSDNHLQTVEYSAELPNYKVGPVGLGAKAAYEYVAKDDVSYQQPVSHAEVSAKLDDMLKVVYSADYQEGNRSEIR